MQADHDPARTTSWFAMRSPALIGDPVVQCLILIVVTSAVFLAFPGIDLWFSRLFYAPDIGFAASRLGAFIGLRDFHRQLTTWIVIALIAVVLVKLIMPRWPSLVRPRDSLFILATLAVGPGVIANLVFKNNWGRPRPFMVSDFGGDQPFVGIWRITDHCASNCSFVSGEASSAIWLVTLAVVLPERWRPTAAKALLVLALALSLNRIAFGAHFLSDVLLAWGMTLAVMAAFYRLLYVDVPPALQNEHLEAGLTQAGTGLRNAVLTLKDRLGRRNDQA